MLGVFCLKLLPRGKGVLQRGIRSPLKGVWAPPLGTKREDKGKRLFFLYPVDFSAEGKGTACVRGKPSGFFPKERKYF
jgi:hypothetical protein